MPRRIGLGNMAGHESQRFARASPAAAGSRCPSDVPSRTTRHPGSRTGVGGVAATAPESQIDGQWSWGAAIHTSRWRVQRIPAGGREVPSPQTRKVIEASPFDPAATAGALRAPSDRRSLGVVSRPEISQHFQKFALILRRTLPRHSPLCVSDHSPTPVPRGAEDRSKSSRNKARARHRDSSAADTHDRRQRLRRSKLEGHP